MSLIWDAQLVAFNLQRSRVKKMFVAIWSKSLFGLKDMRLEAIRSEAPIKIERFTGDDPSATEIVNDLFPHRRETLGLTEVRVAFCVTANHIHNLIRDGLLASTGGDRVSKAPTIWRASVVNFLENRRLL